MNWLQPGELLEDVCGDVDPGLVCCRSDKSRDRFSVWLIRDLPCTGQGLCDYIAKALVVGQPLTELLDGDASEVGRASHDFPFAGPPLSLIASFKSGLQAVNRWDAQSEPNIGFVFCHHRTVTAGQRHYQGVLA